MKLTSQDDTVERYRRGTLTPEEQTEFEAWVLDKPEILEQLELDTMLSIAVGDAMQSLPRRSTAWVAWLKPLALASAAVVFGVFLGQLNRGEVSSGIKTTLPVQLSPMRGAAKPVSTIINLADAPDAVYFRIQAGSGGSQVRIHYMAGDDSELLTKVALTDEDGFVSVTISRQLLTGSAGSFRISEPGTGRTIRSYPLQIYQP